MCKFMMKVQSSTSAIDPMLWSTFWNQLCPPTLSSAYQLNIFKEYLIFNIPIFQLSPYMTPYPTYLYFTYI